MIQKIKKLALTTIAGLMLLAPAGLVPALAGTAGAEAIVQSVCEGSNVTTGASGNKCGTAGTNGNTGASGTIGKLSQQVVNIFSVLVGAIAVIMIIYGGFRYITSGGDSGRVGNAKNTLIYAIVGLVIVALAQIIVHFVLNTTINSTTGIN